jgi:hypothetical protein
LARPPRGRSLVEQGACLSFLAFLGLPLSFKKKTFLKGFKEGTIPVVQVAAIEQEGVKVFFCRFYVETGNPFSVTTEHVVFLKGMGRGPMSALPEFGFEVGKIDGDFFPEKPEAVIPVSPFDSFSPLTTEQGMHFAGKEARKGHGPKRKGNGEKRVGDFFMEVSGPSCIDFQFDPEGLILGKPFSQAFQAGRRRE